MNNDKKHKRMKNRKMTLLILAFLFLACTNQKTKNENCVSYDSGFSICQDTIFVNIKGNMTHAIKHNDRIYAIFEQRLVWKYGGHGRRWLYIFSNGEVERVVDVPPKMDAVYWDFFVKNDSIIIKQYMDKPHFYFNTQNFTWEETDKVDDLIFEDEKFYVYSLDFGEWGGKTWFKDKKTGVEYLIEAPIPLINKIDTTYFLTDKYRVLKIENPLELNRCDDEDILYENIKNRRKHYSWYGEPIGFDMIYADLDTIHTEYLKEKFTFILPQEINIVSSFVWQNELVHIYQNDTATYIAKIENNTITPIQKIAKNVSFYNRYETYRCRNLNGKNELLKFNTKDNRSFGLMDIVDNKIYLHYFVNKAELEPKSVGTEKADSICIRRFNLLLSDLGNLQLSKIDSLEQKWGTLDITPTHKIGIDESSYPNPNKYELDTCKSYLVQEDSLISNAIIYYSTKATDLVRVISISWEKTDTRNRNDEELTTETFRRKLTFLEKYLVQNLGEPTHIQKETKGKYPSKTWNTTSGFTIKLTNSTSSYNYIGMTVYKNEVRIIN